MARLLLLGDSNYKKNSELYDGPKIKNLEVVSCQSKQVLMNELAGIREGIVVIACLDLIAAEAARKAPRAQERAVELAFNHIILRAMDNLEEADGKLACGIVAPIFWKEHSQEVIDAIHHSYKLAQKSPVPDLWLTNYATGMKVGADRVHLIRRAGRKYVALVNDVFKQIDQQKNFGLVEFEEVSSGARMWANDSNMEDDEPGFDLEPPNDATAPSPSRTLSMVSASMLGSAQGQLSSVQARLQMIANSDVRSGANAMPLSGMSSGAGPAVQPYTGPFRVPPPPPPVPGFAAPQGQAPISGFGTLHSQAPILPPSTWPTMLTPELSDSLSRIEQRLGHLETKSFFDNLMMASLQEESDTEANRVMLNRVTIIGIRIPDLHRMTENEKVNVMKRKVQEVIEPLQKEDQKFEVIFVRHLNRQVRGQHNTVIEVKLASERQAKDLRSNFVEKKKNSSTQDSLNITPVVRLATRVRIEMLHAIAQVYKRQDSTVDKAFCVQFVPKPMIKIVRKDQRGSEMIRHMSFLEAVTWTKEKNLEKAVDFAKAYERAGSAFRATLQQTFVLLE